MLFLFFKVLFIYFKSLFTATFSFKANRPLYLSGTNLVKRSFRLTQADYKNPFIVIKGFLRFAKSNFLDKKNKIEIVKEKEFIYDLNPDSEQIRKSYIKHYTGNEFKNLISKELLIANVGMLNKIIICFVYFLILIPVFVFTLFSKKKAGLSLLFKEIVENAVLLNMISRNELKECYFFSIYEKDANLAAYLMMNAGVNVIKIPSEVPFYFFNTTIICSKLIICNAYQFDELKFYKENMVYQNTEMWGPERATDFYDIYKNKNFSIQRKAVAFYSTASWVREKEGHIDQGTNMIKNEQLLLSYLKEYIGMNKGLKLMIYVHPKEKADKYINETKKYYSSILENVEFEFADFNILSAASFFNAELAVAFNSTLIHERLYFGFKTLILPLNHDGFPVVDSSFKNICASSKEELFSKMDKALAQNESEFFTSNGIENYLFE